MTTHVESVKASAATMFIAQLASLSKDGGNEHLHAGGSFPDIILDMKREGHISDNVYVSGARFIHDLTRCHGTSAGLTSRYGDQVDAGRGERLPPRFATDVDAFARVDRVLAALWDHEREVLTFCVLSREAKRGALVDYGRQRSAFKTRQQTRAVAIGQICSLLRSIHEAYHMKIPIPS